MMDNQLCADSAAGNAGVSCACRQGSAGGCWRGPGRATRMRRRSGGERSKAKRSARKAVARLVTALVGSALALGGCRTDSTFEFKADGSVRTEIVFEDDTGSMRTLKQTCEDLREYFGSIGDFAANARMEDITPPGGHLTCKATSHTPLGSVKLVGSGDTYTLTLKPTDETKEDMDGLTARTTIVMPGKVVKTSMGTVRGNKVVITGVDYLAGGLKITSEKEGPRGPSSSSESRNSADKRPSDGDNGQSFPLWVWVGVGCAALIGLALGGTVFVRAARRKRRRAAAQAQSANLYRSLPPERTPRDGPGLGRFN